MKKIYRVKKYTEFKEIINNHQFIKNDIFKIYYKENVYNFERYGIRVTRKNGNAVIRNKIKRQIREIINFSTDYSKNIDFIIIVNNNYLIDNFGLNKTSLNKLVSKIRSQYE